MAIKILRRASNMNNEDQNNTKKKKIQSKHKMQQTEENFKIKNKTK